MVLSTKEKKVHVHPIVIELLKNRGIVSPNDILTFLNPNYDTELHDPFLLKDMGKAVDRILKAITDGEKIVIFSDYDTDGIPSGVMMYDFFKKIGHDNFINYIPHRHKEGYGLNKEAISTFVKDDASLLITADCAITDHEEIAYAHKLGIDVIVTDHHLPSRSEDNTRDELPPAYAVINPKREDDTYPFDSLCGCGVAFKLINALLLKGKEKGIFDVKEGWEKWLLDMVGIATISDMVPLVGENRVLAYYGLKVLRKSSRPGLVNLLQKARVEQRSMSEDDIGFGIGPRLNAASRMDTPMRAFELLTTSNESEAVEISKHLEKLNTRRKTLVASIVKEAHKIIEGREIRDIIVVGSPNWQVGVLGLVANSLAVNYGKSVFAWGRGEDGGDIKGSCRSDGTISVVDCMKNAKSSFISFGGHRASGGFSVSNDNIHTLEDALVSAYGVIEKEEQDTEISFDMELSLNDVTWETFNLINKLAPFGIGNPKPLFLFKDREIYDIRWFGKEKNHIEIVFMDDNGRRVSAITFFARENDVYSTLEKGMNITFKAHMERSIFMGRVDLRLKIIDLIMNNEL